MNSSAPPPNLEDRHAATIARLLVLLDQLLCAIGEQARLPWYARWLVPARAMRPVMAWSAAWIERLRGENFAFGEQVRNGAFDEAADWDEPSWDEPDSNATGSGAESRPGAARGAVRPGGAASSAGRDGATMPDGVETAGDACEPRLAAAEFDRDDDGQTPDGAAAQADPPDGDARSEDTADRHSATDGNVADRDPGLDWRSGLRSGGGEAIWRGRRRQPPDDLRARRYYGPCDHGPCEFGSGRAVFRGRRGASIFTSVLLRYNNNYPVFPSARGERRADWIRSTRQGDERWVSQELTYPTFGAFGFWRG